MSTPQNQAAWLDAAGTPLRVDDAPLPTAGPGEIIVKNAAVAVAPLDNHIQDLGVFVQQWPTYFGSDVAGTVHEVGEGVTRFKVGDRVIGHAIGFVTGRPQDGAFAKYTTILASKAAILPIHIPFTDGVVLPLALETAVTALCLSTPGEALPGVPTPALSLPLPTLQPSLTPSTTTTSTVPPKSIIIYGGSSSVGQVSTQIAISSNLAVYAITSAKNAHLSTSLGASAVFDYASPDLIPSIVSAIKSSNTQFVGILDAIATASTFVHDFAILEKLGGGHLAASHPPPAEKVPENVKAGMFFGVNDVATPVWEGFVTEALERGVLKCAPRAKIVGKGLEFVDVALGMLKEGVSATKLVVEL